MSHMCSTDATMRVCPMYLLAIYATTWQLSCVV
jgi:hypothetical protein